MKNLLLICLLSLISNFLAGQDTLRTVYSLPCIDSSQAKIKAFFDINDNEVIRAYPVNLLVWNGHTLEDIPAYSLIKFKQVRKKYSAIRQEYVTVAELKKPTFFIRKNYILKVLSE